MTAGDTHGVRQGVPAHAMCHSRRGAAAARCTLMLTVHPAGSSMCDALCMLRITERVAAARQVLWTRCAAVVQRERFHFLPGMQELLQQLAGSGATMHAVTNYPVWWRLIEDKLRLSQYMSWTFASCEGPMKVCNFASILATSLQATDAVEHAEAGPQ